MTKTVEELVKKRDEFLAKHPHLQPYQDKLNKDMKNGLPRRPKR